MRPERGGEVASLVEGVATAWTRGVDVDWAAYLGGGTLVDVPTYAFQRQTYWITPKAVERPVEKWGYRVEWQGIADQASILHGTWLIIAPTGGVDDGFLQALTTAGADTRIIQVDASGTDRQALAGQCPDAEVAGVISLLALDETTTMDSGTTLALVLQALGDAEIAAPLWVFTRGATGPDEPTAPLQASAWGLGRVAALEHPARWGGLIDLPAQADGTVWSRVVAALSGQENELAVRSHATYVRRLSPAPIVEGESWQPHGTVLVTGGTGALGAHVARWLAANGAEHLVLTSRRGENAPGVAELRAELSGIDVTFAACDVADPDAVAQLVAEHRITAVVHTAGVRDDGVVDSVTAERSNYVRRPKVEAVANLFAATEGMDLDAFVVFSSIAGVLGLAGQGVYAGANAAVDALVATYRARGARATSIAWGPWAGGGMADSIGDTLRRQGLVPINPTAALAAMRRALARDEAEVMVADIVWDRFATSRSLAEPFIAELTGATHQPVTAVESPAATLEQTLIALPAAERDRALIELVRKQAALVLGHPDISTVATEQPFRELGVDSLTAVQLRNRLAAVTGLDLTTGLVFDYPTASVLGTYLRSRLLPDEPAAERAVLEQIDRLEGLVAGSAVGEDVRRQLSGRLAAVLAKLHDTGPVRTVSDADLETVEDEDIFRFIDEDLGLE
ncbi:beta-ketoacyl reductase [Streptomyces sp. 8L]|uniref:beta-ketoacyl reductase n=1 Tax=Streptomyces sp. 8L TaxID=2877242 RepID=UPI001CD32BBF|nr:beta-ketoacyl reductase [Streptomyces sp. 8L]MCA1223808.1 beta-ketoacyl reductase [Streptomyces sp. 8L]